MTLPYFHVDTRNERLKTLATKHGSLWNEFNQKLDISWIFHDHGLEGTVLVVQEITSALSHKPNADTSSQPMYQEVSNMQASISMIRGQLENEKSDRITRSLLQQCYTLLSNGIRGVQKGDGIRQEDGRYGAYYHKSCTFSEVEDNMKRVLAEANQTSTEDLHPIVQATRFHFNMMKVMPFGRFSGKITRLISNLILMRNGYPPAILHTVERARYYEALAEDNEHKLLHLVIEGLTTTVSGGLQYIEEGLAERRRKREARKALREQKEEKARTSKTSGKKSTTKKSTASKPTAAKSKSTRKADGAAGSKSKSSSTTKKASTGTRKAAKKSTTSKSKTTSSKTAKRKTSRTKSS